MKYFDRQILILNKFHEATSFHIFNKAFGSFSRCNLGLICHVLRFWCPKRGTLSLHLLVLIC
jgi:hypothetical protein